MRAYYELALAEHEGLGTAYEYYVKARLLDRVVGRRSLQSLLILGLPERYGYSMDFLHFAGRQGAQIDVVDERADRLEQHARITLQLRERGLLPSTSVARQTTQNWTVDGRIHDLGLGCEVLQRLGPDARERYAATLARRCRAFVLFAPNAGNAAHIGLSGLKTVEEQELVAIVRSAGATCERSGLIDCPPFPPGLHMISSTPAGSADRRIRNAVKRLVLRSAAPWLTPFALLETRYPSSVRARQSHIVWAIGRSRR